MRLALIGPGDTEFHYQELLGIPKEKFYSEIEKIAKSLVNSRVEIELLPDKGVCFEIAKLYKQKKGKKVIATIPKSDKEIGIKHLEPYINQKIDDEQINSGDWYKHDMTKALFGHATLYLGHAPGTEIERNGAEYLYKFLKYIKIHPEIKAGDNYTLFVYSPFLASKKLTKEDEAYLRKDKIRLIYIKNAKQLERELKKFQKK